MPGETIFTADFFVELLVWAGVALVVGVVATMVADRYFVSREVEAPDGGRGWSAEVWARSRSSDHPRLRKRWRPGRAVFSQDNVQLGLFKGGLRFRQHPPFVIAVAGLERDSVRPAGWLTNLRLAASHQLLVLTTDEGARVELAVPSEDVEEVLDVLLGRPRRTKQLDESWREDLPGWASERAVHVVGRAVVDSAGVPVSAADMKGQLLHCLEDVREQLEQRRVGLSDVTSVTVRTTAVHAVQPHIGVLASQLREVGATPTIRMLLVERLSATDQVVELDATATI